MGRVITVCQSGGFQAGTRHEAVVFGEEGLHHNRDQADEIRQGLSEIVEAGRLMGTHEEESGYGVLSNEHLPHPFALP